MANTGVTYLPRFTVEKELRAGLLQELPLSPRLKPFLQCVLITQVRSLRQQWSCLFSPYGRVWMPDRCPRI